MFVTSCEMPLAMLITKITEVNLSAFAYRMFHEDFSSIHGAKCTLHLAPRIEEKSS